MRLSSDEQKKITYVIRRALGPTDFELYLYGSRINDELKGGDIDLLLLVDDKHANETRSLQFKLIAQIKDLIGDQKIDLAIYAKNQAGHLPFLDLILKEALVIFRQNGHKDGT